MKNINRLIPIIMLASIIVFLIFDIKSDCQDIDRFNITRGKILYEKYRNLLEKYKNLSKESENLKSKYGDKLEKFGIEGEINKLERDIKIRLENVNKYINYLNDIEKFKENFCNKVICISESDTCNYKFEQLLRRTKGDLEKVEEYLYKLEKVLFQFKFAVENGDLLIESVKEALNKMIENYSEMERTISKYARLYPFNKDEIEKRGKFYLNKLKGEIDLLKKYIDKGNLYKLADYCKVWEYRKIIENKCNGKNLKKLVEGDSSQNKKLDNCKDIKIDILNICLAKANTIYNEFKKTFEELDKDFFVILLDKKAEYVAVFSVYSWDDLRDYPVEYSTTYKVEIEEDLYKILEYFVKKYGYENWLCRYKYGGKLICKMSNSKIKNLASYFINNSRNFGNAYEIYVEDLYKVFYHKYEFKGNLYNEPQNVKWIEVDENTYKLFNRKNRIIMVKPKGYFGDQVIVKPDKIYSSLIGNKIYGYYDNNGIWHWLPMYLFLMNYLDRYYYTKRKEIPPYIKDEILRNYYSNKDVLREYAKKHGLCKNNECEKKRDGTYGVSNYRGGLRGLSGRYRGRGYGGLGK